MRRNRADPEPHIDYSYADILNVSIDRGPLRSTIRLNLCLDGSALSVDDFPNEEGKKRSKSLE